MGKGISKLCPSGLCGTPPAGVDDTIELDARPTQQQQQPAIVVNEGVNRTNGSTDTPRTKTPPPKTTALQQELSIEQFSGSTLEQPHVKLQVPGDNGGLETFDLGKLSKRKSFQSVLSLQSIDPKLASEEAGEEKPVEARQPYVPPSDAQRQKTAAEIKGVLENAFANPNGQILALGYSPTGGGHTARALDIAEMALAKGDLKKGDVVVLNVPVIWGGKPRTPLVAFAQKMHDAGIHVVMAEANKSVQGFLKGTGGSDDVKILTTFANLPLRPKADIDSILHAHKYTGGSEEERAKQLNNLPVISAKDLMKSLADLAPPDAEFDAGMSKTKSLSLKAKAKAKDLIRTATRRGSEVDFGEGTSKSKGKGHLAPGLANVKVLTDMDYALQKGAKDAGIPGDQRLDQQNHAILIELREHLRAANLTGANAVVSKVLNTHGAKVSHIGLGDKNTLPDIANLIDQLKITANTTRAQALTKAADFLLKNSKTAVTDPNQAKACEGIIHSPNIKSAADVKNIVFVYAHANQHRIGKLIEHKAGAGPDSDKGPKDIHDAYKGTLFVMGGSKTAFNGANGLHAALIADADVICTAGAGMAGEISYLHKQGGAEAALLSLPIEHHPEQQANAKQLANDEATHEHVNIVSDTRNPDVLRMQVHSWIQKQFARATDPKDKGNKYRPEQNMAKMLHAIGQETYVEQAYKALFKGENLPINKTVTAAEKEMANSARLTANFKFLKLVIQAIESGKDGGPITIKLTEKGQAQTFENFAALNKAIGDDAQLTKTLGMPNKVDSTEMKGLDDTRTLFDTMDAAEDAEAKKKMVKKFLEKFAGNFPTGF